MLHTLYQQRVVCKDQLRQAILDAKLTLSEVQFDSIAVCGVSGMFGTALSLVLDKHLLLVRKTTDKLYKDIQFEYNDVAQRYVIVDDHLVTGATIKHINDVVSRHLPSAVCVGHYFYHDDSYGLPKFIQVS